MDISDIPDQSIQKSLTDVSNCITVAIHFTRMVIVLNHVLFLIFCHFTQDCEESQIALDAESIIEFQLT